jgi:hypothetical protein
MRGAWEAAAAGSAGKRGGKNFLIWGDLRGRGCCGNWLSSTVCKEKNEEGTAGFCVFDVDILPLESYNRNISDKGLYL